MASFAISMSHLPWHATTYASAVRLTPICNLSIVRKSSAAFLGVPLHFSPTTRIICLSPTTRSSTIGIRHDSSLTKNLLQIKKKDNFLNEQFFNREREMKLLSMRLGAETPKIILILGPPDSGKTALVREVVNSTPNINPIFIDLREGTFNNVESTINSLRCQFNTYFYHLGKALRNIEDSELNVVKVMYEGASISLDPTRPPKVQFIDLLKEINSRLLFHSTLMSYDVPRPVLVIDEANKFMSLAQTKEGKVTVKTFLLWLEMNTTRFHVVLTSSNPDFLHWIQGRLNRLGYMIVGDLTKSEAERFFHGHILTLPRYESVKQELSNKFNQVFDMTGGRTAYIVAYVDLYLMAKVLGENFQEDLYEPYWQAYGYLYLALSPEFLNKLYPERAPARFSQEQLVSLMKMFVESSNGFILKDEADDKFGPDTVQSFLEYNIVHKRPPGRNLDVPGSPNLDPILLPINRPQLRAMQALLQS